MLFSVLLRVPQQMTLPFAEIAHQPGVMRYETVNKEPLILLTVRT
jgi:hypothetical protein